MPEDKKPVKKPARKPRALKKATPKPKAKKIEAVKTEPKKLVNVKRRVLSEKEISLANQLATIFDAGYTIKMVAYDREMLLKNGGDFIGFLREYEAVDFVCSKAGHQNRCIHAR